MTTTSAQQIDVPCSIIRGGTSKGVYFDGRDLPSPGDERDALLKAVIGSEDLLQIDGLGGSRLVTAKLAIVSPSSRPDTDVDYTYGIVPMGLGRVVYTSNCGNISAGVGPFAIDHGLVALDDAARHAGVKMVRIFNTNTGKSLTAHVPLARDGRAAVNGGYAIPGVPGTGAEILMDYRGTIGAKTGRGLPTGHATDTIEIADGRRFEVSLGDVGNPCVFIAASALGLTGSELPHEIDANSTVLELLREIRGRAAAMLGFCADWTRAEADSPALPLMVMVEGPADCVTTDGHALAAGDMDLRARLVFYNRCHESMAGTGAVCTAAVASVARSVVQKALRRARPDELRIGHPLGAMRVVAQARSDHPDGLLRAQDPLLFERLGFSRTARCLMKGVASVPNPAALAVRQMKEVS